MKSMTKHPKWMNRRAFLKAGGLALVTLGTGPAFLQRAARAAQEPTALGRRKVLVTIFQRGAMDGLAAVAPVGAEEQLAKLRPRLGMSAAQGAGDEALIDLGVGFGLHPALAPLVPLWKAGQLGIVHAVGSPDPTRSHFDAQDFMETGTPGRKGTPDGWLNRVAGKLGHDATPFRAMALTPTLPRSLYGPEPAMAVADLREFHVQSPAMGAVDAGRGFEALYAEASANLLRDTARETFEATRTLEQLDVSKYRAAPEARYPSGPLARSLRQIAFLIKSNIGLEVAFAESGGWDTHVLQGSANGSFARRAADLSSAIAAFWTDLGTHRDDVVVLTMTEFGRTAFENGSGGTDHGHGSCLFVLGRDVLGGKVHGEFPGLARDALFEGRDLAITTDFRSVFAEVASRHLGVADDATLFPGWEGNRLPLWRPA